MQFTFRHSQKRKIKQTLQLSINAKDLVVSVQSMLDIRPR